MLGWKRRESHKNWERGGGLRTAASTGPVTLLIIICPKVWSDCVVLSKVVVPVLL